MEHDFEVNNDQLLALRGAGRGSLVISRSAEVYTLPFLQELG